jgi:hypothetical protein
LRAALTRSSARGETRIANRGGVRTRQEIGQHECARCIRRRLIVRVEEPHDASRRGPPLTIHRAKPDRAERRIVILISDGLDNSSQTKPSTVIETALDTAGVCLILIASAPDKLLPTIRSRCSKVHFAPLPRSLLEERARI